MLDAIQFEKRGLPAAAIVTEPFVLTGRSIAELSRMSGYPFAVVPHPFGSIDLAEVQARADAITREVERLLLETPSAKGADAPRAPPAGGDGAARGVGSGAMDITRPTDRLDYVPITRRPPLPLPDGARIVVWPCVNVEHWVIDEPMPRTIVNPPGGVKTSVPDIPNWSWHEYGQRVGFWRLKQIFDDFGVAGSLVMNASVCDVYPQIVDACLASGWDVVGHGYIQKALPPCPTSAR